MELEDLKQKWEELSQQIEKQEIINKKLLENIFEKKRNTLILYNYTGIFLLFVGVSILLIIKPLQFFPSWFIYYTLSVLLIAGIWQMMSFRFLLKTKSYKNNLQESESFFIKYRKSEILNYMIQYMLVIPCYIFLFVDLQPTKYMYNFAIILFAILATFCGSVWYFRKIKGFRESIENLKEFKKM